MQTPIARCATLTDWCSTFSQCLYEWQALIAGFFALAAAGATIFVIRLQISQTERHNKEALQRKHAAIRATFPLTLSGLSDWAEQMLKELKQAKTMLASQNSGNLHKQFSPPLPPTVLISDLQQVIATSEVRNVNEILKQIIREIQILISCTQELKDKQKMKSQHLMDQNILNYMIQATQIDVLVRLLFEYSREETETAPQSAAWKSVYDHPMHIAKHNQDLDKMINQRSAGKQNFWEINDR